MSTKKKKETNEPEKDPELDNLEKLGLMMGTLEKRANKRLKNEMDSKNDDFIEKANQKKEKETIQDSAETSATLFDINEELVGTLFIPIDLFINDGLESKGINPFTESEIKKLLDLILKLLPSEVLTKITEMTKKTKKITWFKNIDKILAISKHLYKMFGVRFRQYKSWKKTQEDAEIIT
jgi:hypothetical protein